MIILEGSVQSLEFVLCNQDDKNATKNQVRNNLEEVKNIATKEWGIYGLADGRLTGSGYGWKIEDALIETSDNICVIKEAG